MIPFAIAILGALSRVTWPDIAGLLLPLSAIALLGYFGLWLARRGSAALRHLIALAALVSMIALPGLGAMLRPWASWSVATRWVPSEHAASANVGAGDTRMSRSSVSAASASLRPATPPAVPRRDAVDDREPASRWSDTTVGRQNLPAAVAGAALAIACLLLLRIAFGLLVAAWAVRAAVATTDVRLARELEAARERLGISRRVGLASSSTLAVPVVSGLFRPTLVLPAAAASWTGERLRAVLLHELAHVRRGDAASLVIGRVATALFWFHPLAWLLARAMRRECERACDDVVLASGLKASDYADHLLAIARAAVGRRVPSLTLAFARTSSLEGRLLTVLRSDLRREPTSTRAQLAAGLIALLVLLPLSAIRVVGARAEAAEPWMDGAADRAPVVAAEPGIGGSEQKWKKKETEKSVWKQETWKQEEKIESFGADSDEPAETEAEVAGTKSATDLYQRAKSLYDAKRYQEAGQAYEAAARGNYRPATSWYNAACSYALDSQKLRALGALQRSIAAGYDDVNHIQGDSDLDSIRQDGRFRLMIEDLRHSDAGERQKDRAVEKYESLRGSGSAEASDWNSAGIELMRAGETELAIQAFQRRVAIDGSASGIYNQACAEALGGQTSAALSSLRRSIVAGYGSKGKLTEDADLASLRGKHEFDELVRLVDDLTIDHASGDDRDRELWKEQLPRYEGVARRHPDLGRAWFNLGYVQIRAGEHEGARESFQHALDKVYRKPTTLYNLACASAQLGDRDAAMRWLRQAEAAGMDLGNAQVDEDLNPLRSDARFRALMDRVDRNRDDHKGKANKQS